MNLNIDEVIKLTQQIQPVLTFLATGSFTTLVITGWKALLEHLRDKRTQKFEENKFEVKNKDDLIEELSAMIQTERVKFKEDFEEERKRCAEQMGHLQGQISALQNQVAILLNGQRKSG